MQKKLKEIDEKLAGRLTILKSHQRELEIVAVEHYQAAIAEMREASAQADDDCKKVLVGIDERLGVGYAQFGYVVISPWLVVPKLEQMEKRSDAGWPTEHAQGSSWRTETTGSFFPGGGALGSWEVSCYRALQTRYNGPPPRIVTGASSGALNAVGVAAGMTPQQLAQLWGQLTNDGVYRANISTSDFIKLGFRSIFSSTAVTAFISRRRSYFDTGPLQATLLTILRDYWMSFAQSQTYCAISLTNLTTSRREFFYKLPPGQILPPPGNTATVWERLESLPMLVQTLMGSTALPILFPPHGIYFDAISQSRQRFTSAIP